MTLRRYFGLLLPLLILMVVSNAFAAYDHGGADTDSARFLEVYPDKADTKLDSCALCHTSGQYEKKPGKWVTLGSCQWCHYAYGYNADGDIGETLNDYGRDYQVHGNSVEAFAAIASLDSDGDGYSNIEEIDALRFPGDADDDPTKVPAPYRVYSLQDLHTLPRHSQFMLMNTHKSGDFYARYTGAAMADILLDAGMLLSATGIKVYAPDGWSQYHPLEEDADPLFYHVFGAYPQASFYYDVEADQDINPAYGWCDYASPACTGRVHGDVINVDGGLQLMLAYMRDGACLAPGVLTADNKLDGEGPFRVVPPQKVPGPPDQSSKYSGNDDPLWPFDEWADHNAGFATRSATIIRVDPLPNGTTDIDPLEAGWDYVDEGKILVYGAIDPLPTVFAKLKDFRRQLRDQPGDSFKHRWFKWIMAFKIRRIERMTGKGDYHAALSALERHLLTKTDGCMQSGAPDRTDWIVDCDIQARTYWAIHEISVLLKIAE